MTEVQKIEFSPEAMLEVSRIVSHYPQDKMKSALLPVLHIAQNEFGGWLSADVMDYVARLLHIQPIEVYEVATFYSMYNTKPVGKILIEVCQTGPCCWRNNKRQYVHFKNSGMFRCLWLCSNVSDW